MVDCGYCVVFQNLIQEIKYGFDSKSDSRKTIVVATQNEKKEKGNAGNP